MSACVCLCMCEHVSLCMSKYIFSEIMPLDVIIFSPRVIDHLTKTTPGMINLLLSYSLGEHKRHPKQHRLLLTQPKKLM